MEDKLNLQANLQNKTIVITRAKNQIGDSSLLLKETGANVIEFPAIKIVEPDDWKFFDHIIQSEKFDLIIFTSVNAVNFFSNRIKELNLQSNFSEVKIIAVGSKTKQACKSLFNKVDYTPIEYSSKGIIEIFDIIDLSGKNVLLPQSEIAKRDLAEEIMKKNANVFQVSVYKNILLDKEEVQEAIDLIKSSKEDVFIFTSPSTFRNFLTLMEISEPVKYFEGKLIAAIGDTTKNEINKYGINSIITPDSSTIENLIFKISDYFKSSGGKVVGT